MKVKTAICVTGSVVLLVVGAILHSFCTKIPNEHADFREFCRAHDHVPVRDDKMLYCVPEFMLDGRQRLPLK